MINIRHIGGCAIGLLLLSASCSEAPHKAPDTRAADEKTIRDGEVAWNSDWASKDVDKIASHYADDGALMVPGAPVMKGIDAIRSSVKGMLADKNLALAFTTTFAEVSKGGDFAYTEGTYTLTQTNPRTKKPATENGKYVTIYKKQSDGSWKAVADIANADAPPASAPAPAPSRSAKQPHKFKAKHGQHRHR